MGVVLVVAALLSAQPGPGEVWAPPSEVDAPEAPAFDADGSEHGVPSPRKAALFSLIFPGAGHFYLGDTRTGAGLVSLGAIEIAALCVTMLDDWPEARRSEPSGIGGDIEDPTFLLASIWFQNTWTWGIFSAWRDARLLVSPTAAVAREGLGELVVAPLTVDTMLEPEVLLGIVGWVGAAALLSHWLDDGGLTGGSTTLFEDRSVRFLGRDYARGPGIALGEGYYTMLFVPVGIGEEALFRGYLQTTLSDALGPTAGWALATLAFGLAHAPNALLLEDRDDRVQYLTQSLPFITLVGGYLGWIYRRNERSLSEVVAFHFWYDLLLGTVSFLTRPDDQPFSIGVGVPF